MTKFMMRGIAAHSCVCLSKLVRMCSLPPAGRAGEGGCKLGTIDSKQEITHQADPPPPCPSPQGGGNGNLIHWLRISTIVLLLIQTTPAHAADPILPDPVMTPGAVLTTDAHRVCQPDYSKSVRHTSTELKKEIYREYGAQWQPGHYEVDHLIPLGIGGADVKENLWPESHFTQPWSADTKDRLEWKLYKLVCAKKLDISEAQKSIAANWIKSYQRFCPTEKDCPSYDEEYPNGR